MGPLWDSTSGILAGIRDNQVPGTLDSQGCVHYADSGTLGVRVTPVVRALQVYNTWIGHSKVQGTVVLQALCGSEAFRNSGRLGFRGALKLLVSWGFDNYGVPGNRRDQYTQGFGSPRVRGAALSGTPEQVVRGMAAGASGTTRPSKPCARHFRQRAGAVECLLPAAGGAEAERGAGPAQPWTGSWGEWRRPAQRGAVRGGGERSERGRRAADSRRRLGSGGWPAAAGC